MYMAHRWTRQAWVCFLLQLCLHKISPARPSLSYLMAHHLEGLPLTPQPVPA